jgi:hypothetical protein
MKTKHTPGPWMVKHSESKIAFNVISTALGAKYKIAICPYIHIVLGERGEAEANAKLIAAAPELLETLNKLVNLKHYKEANGKDDYYSEAQPLAWKNAIESIKKATE